MSRFSASLEVLSTRGSPSRSPYHPVSITFPLEATTSFSSDGNSKQHAERSASIDSPGLKAELARLQEKEATLSHMLILEKDRRVQAEQLMEVQKLVCLEMKHKLDQQRKTREGYRESVDEEKNKDPNVSYMCIDSVEGMNF